MKPRNSQSFIPVCCYVSHSWGLLSTSTYFFQESLKTRVFGTSALSALSSRTKNASKIKTNFEIKLRPLGDPKLYSKNSDLRDSGPPRGTGDHTYHWGSGVHGPWAPAHRLTPAPPGPMGSPGAPRAVWNRVNLSFLNTG